MIFIAIPVHDEAQTVGAVLWKIRRVMRGFGRDYEIVVLDDASADETPEVLARYGDRLPLRVIRSDERLGYGRALERLMRDTIDRSRYPKRDVLVSLQADFTEDPADIVPMIKSVEGGADLVAGRLDGIDVSMPRNRRLSQWAARLLLGGTLRKAPVQDPFAGLRAYRVIVLKKAFRDEGGAGNVQSDAGWPVSLELLALTAPYARRIEESPYRLRYAHRERDSRFEAVPTLKALYPLRRLSWAQAGEDG